MGEADVLWLKGVAGKELTPEAKQRVEVLAATYGVELTRNCPNRWRDGVFLILSKIKKMARQKKQRYTLQRGIAFTYSGVIYSAQNITDEAVEWWLKQNPDNARYVAENAEWRTSKIKPAPTKGTTTKGDE